MNNLHICLNSFSNGSRVLKQTESLLKQGVFDEVHIAAIWKNDLKVEEQYPSGAKVVRYNLRTRALQPALFRYALMYLEFSYRLWRGFRKAQISCVNVHSVGVLPLGYLLKRLWSCQLVYDAHELESMTHGLSRIRKNVFTIVESLLIRRVELMIVVSDSIAKWYMEKYSIPEPAVVLNVPRLSELKQSQKIREIHKIPADRKILLYQGLLDGPRGIQLLLDSFLNGGFPGYVIVFMGYGPMQDELKLASESHDNIYFQNAVSPEELPIYTASCDVGMSIVENSCLSYYYSLPNKLFEYAMCGIPIIVSDCLEMRNFVTQNNVGVVLESMSRESLEQALHQISEAGLLNDRQRIHDVAVKYRWEVQEMVMLEAYRSASVGQRT